MLCFSLFLLFDTKYILIRKVANALSGNPSNNQPCYVRVDCGWPPVVHTTRGVANNQHERPKRSLFTGPRYNTLDRKSVV